MRKILDGYGISPLEFIRPICKNMVSEFWLNSIWEHKTYIQKRAREKLSARGFSWMGRGDLVGTYGQFCDEIISKGYAII